MPLTRPLRAALHSRRRTRPSSRPGSGRLAAVTSKVHTRAVQWATAS